MDRRGEHAYARAAPCPGSHLKTRMPTHGATRFEEMVAAHAGSRGRSPLARYFADPYGFFAWARAEAPVLYVPEVDWWAVARYHDIRSVFRDPETFSSSIIRPPMTSLCPRAREICESAGVRMEPALVDEGPATHPRHRRFFGEGLSKRSVGRLEPRIRSIVTSQIDGFIDHGRTDLLAGLLQPAANRTVLHLLGAEGECDLAHWPGGMRRVETWAAWTEDAQVSLMNAVARSWSFSGGLVKSALASPGDDYLGAAVRARRADPSLFTDNYLHNIAFLLQTSGADNLSLTLANGIRALLEAHTPWPRLCADPGLIPNAVEEILRFGAFVLVSPRLATRATEVGGRRIPAGARIMLLRASGNRDETVFPDGERLDIDRENARDHLSFGHGPHFCLGAPLSRLQMKIILEELTRRLPHLRLADGGVPDVFRAFTFRGLRQLAVEWR